MWNGIDKRRFPRANYKCIIFIKKSLISRHIKTHTENIGVGGICVVLKHRLKPFEEVKLKLMLDNGSSPVQCRGRVMWDIKRDLPAEKALYDTGIEFINLKEEDKSRIEKIVKTLIKDLDKYK